MFESTEEGHCIWV